MNTQKIIYKFFFIIGTIAIGLTLLLGILGRLYWGGVSTQNTIETNTVITFGEKTGLDGITSTAKYSPLWIDTNAINVEIDLLNGDDGTCVVVYDEESRSFSAKGIGTGIIKVSNTLDQTIDFIIPFETKFKSEDTINWLENEAADGIITDVEIEAVKQININDSGSIDVIDLSFFANLESIAIDVESEILHFTNAELISSDVPFYVPQPKYSEYINDSQWKTFDGRIFPNITGDGCVVVFDFNGGTIKDIPMVDDYHFEKIKTNDNVGISNYNTIKKTGFTFKGWKTSTDGEITYGQDVTENTHIKNNLKIYALWDENEYTIKYDVNESGVSPVMVASQKVKYSEQIGINEEKLKKAGYTFKGWTTNANSTSVEFTPGQLVSKLTPTNNGEVQLYAVWEANEYAIYYYELGSTNYQDKQNMVYDQVVTVKNAASKKTGHKFVGWATESGSTIVKYKPGQTIKNVVSEDGAGFSLYAVWEPIKYSISFSTFDVGEVSNLPIPETATYDVEHKLSDKKPERFGYEFLGWSTQYTHGTGAYDELPQTDYKPGATVYNLSYEEGTVTLWAVWKADSFNIVFNANGGSGENKTYTVNYGEDLKIDDDEFNRTNYLLDGWSTSSSSQSADYASNKLGEKDISSLYKKINSSNSVTLYAIWKPYYTIKYDSAGGSKTPNNQLAAVGSYVELASEIKKTGYIFDGWSYGGRTYDAEESVKDLTTSAGMTVTLVATWSPIKYTIKYDLNGASGSMESAKVSYDQSYSLLAPPTREGYAFGGWSYDGETYKSGASVKNLVTKNNSTVTMKAIWTAKQ